MRWKLSAASLAALALLATLAYGASTVRATRLPAQTNIAVTDLRLVGTDSGFEGSTGLAVLATPPGGATSVSILSRVAASAPSLAALSLLPCDELDPADFTDGTSNAVLMDVPLSIINNTIYFDGIYDWPGEYAQRARSLAIVDAGDHSVLACGSLAAYIVRRGRPSGRNADVLALVGGEGGDGPFGPDRPSVLAYVTSGKSVDEALSAALFGLQSNTQHTLAFSRRTCDRIIDHPFEVPHKDVAAFTTDAEGFARLFINDGIRLVDRARRARSAILGTAEQPVILCSAVSNSRIEYDPALGLQRPSPASRIGVPSREGQPSLS